MNNRQVEPLKKVGLLKFLGVQGGGSTSHTNAYFFPDKKTLVFIDLSLLNYGKARTLLESARNDGINRVILCLTHTHDDHASGVIFLAFAVREIFEKSIILEVITSSEVAFDASRRLWSSGGRTVFSRHNERDDEVYHLFSISNNRVYYYNNGSGVGCELRQKDFFQRPEWLLEIVPTSHSPRLTGACGFIFKVDETVIIYSGDTNSYSNFEKLALNIFRAPLKTEFYLDVKSIKIHTHLYWRDVKDSLCNLYKESGKSLTLILIHYDNPRYFQRELTEINKKMRTDWAFLATKEF